MNDMVYEKVIGLEIHVRLKSKTKMFCSCKNALELAPEPNLNVCPVCMGFPGMLPALNEEVVRLGTIAGILMGCQINKHSRFDRKSYFYPDLPNSFQITQMYETIVWEWEVRALVNGEMKSFSIHHMHLENDAGKLVHAGGRTMCDYNRAGSPLMEIVTNPTFHDKEEVMEFLKELQKMFRAYGVSDADMEKGQLRCDVNISLRKFGVTTLGTKVELKNLNSFSAIGRAIDAETKRQARMLDAGEEIAQETRGWDDDKGMSSTQRSKENAMDYRYFPEPDLLPLDLTDEFIEDCRTQTGELPLDKRIRYLHDYSLSEDDARILTLERETSDYFEELFKITNDAKKSCSYITTVLMALMNESYEIKKFSDLKFDIKELAEVIKLVNADEISSTNSKLVVEELFKNGGNTQEIVDRLGVRQKNDTEALEKVVDEMIAQFPTQVADFKSGNEKVFWFLVWQCMKLSAGQWNPKIFNDLIRKKLS